MKKLFISIFTRILKLIIKLISVKGLVFFMGTTLVFHKVIDGWIWFALAILIVSTRMFEKFIAKLPGIK